jgi:WD40 repeat protein
MSVDDRRPVIFLAFANDREDSARYLRNLPEETRRVRERLVEPQTAGFCQVEVRTNITVGELLDVFQDSRYRDRIAVFHFGGHAGGYQLLMESAEGRPEFAHAEGLADFLGHQRGLQLVFLNGCSTQPQVEDLLQSGVPAVIATSESIDDDMATELSARFYASLAGGATIASAYAEAAAAVRTVKGDRIGDLYRRDEAASDRWPWDLHIKEGADVVREWSLPKAARNPLFGLPPPPERDLPDTPYRHLQWFREEDSELFFGRGHEIRTFYELVTSPSAAPVVLFYGQSGVGKSSMLAAGLLPRLASSRQVRYVRRQRNLGLTSTLSAAMGADVSNAALVTAWHALEAEPRQPLVVILDQVEEIYTRPRPDDPDELGQFVRVVSEIFADPSARPRGKLVLGFRKEWLADIEERLRESKISRSKLYLERLDRDGVVEIVEGPAESERLRRHFRVTIEPGLAELIADDLLEDRDAPVAPTLEVLLTKMWKQAMARNADAPAFTVSLYQELRRKGLLLDDFVDEQLTTLRDWNGKLVDTGLALDLLAFHTTSLGTAESRTRAELDLAYAHQRVGLSQLLQQSKDLYLLVDHVAQMPEEGNRMAGTRLAHDTLAPLIRRRFEDSDAPGQRARRILENRNGEWRDGRTGTALDRADLATVERGEAGMPAWSADERRLIQASRKHRRNRQWATRSLLTAGLAAVASIIGLFFSARSSERQATSRALAATAKIEPQLDLALLLSVEAARIGNTFEARDALLGALGSHPGLDLVLRDAGHVSGVAFSPDGRFLASVTTENQGAIWDLASHPPSSRPATAGEVEGYRMTKGCRSYPSCAQDSVGDGVQRLLETITELGVRIRTHAVSPDGQLLAISDGEQLTFWQVATRKRIGEPRSAQGRYVRNLAFSTTGLLASGSSDSTIAIWHVTPGPPIGRVLQGLSISANSVAFSSIGSKVAGGDINGDVLIWDIRTGRQIGPRLVGHGSPVNDLRFCKDSTQLVSASSEVIRWNLDSGQPQGTPQKLPDNAGVAISPDCKVVVLSANDGQLQFLNITTGEFRRPARNEYGARTFAPLAFSPDSRTVASGGGNDWSIVLWDVRTASPAGAPLTAHTTTIAGLDFSADGLKLASLDSDGTMIIWDVSTHQQLGRSLQRTEQYSAQSALALSPDAGTAATTMKEGLLNLWDVATWRPLGRPLPGHPGDVNAVRFSPSGEWLASGSLGGSVILWDLRTESWIDAARRMANRSLSPRERAMYLGSREAPSR